MRRVRVCELLLFADVNISTHEDVHLLLFATLNTVRTHTLAHSAHVTFVDYDRIIAGMRRDRESQSVFSKLKCTTYVRLNWMTATIPIRSIRNDEIWRQQCVVCVCVSALSTFVCLFFVHLRLYRISCLIFENRFIGKCVFIRCSSMTHHRHHHHHRHPAIYLDFCLIGITNSIHRNEKIKTNKMFRLLSIPTDLCSFSIKWNRNKTQRKQKKKKRRNCHQVSARLCCCCCGIVSWWCMFLLCTYTDTKPCYCGSDSESETSFAVCIGLCVFGCASEQKREGESWC